MAHDAKAPTYGTKAKTAVRKPMSPAYGRRKRENAMKISVPKMHASRHCPERNLEYVSVANAATWRMRDACRGARWASIIRLT